MNQQEIKYPTWEGKGGFWVSIIEDSRSEAGARLTTLLCHYWRGIHSEVMTHRVFSRNAQSSRAMPVEAMLRQVENDPFIPWFWGRNQKGMQAGEELPLVEQQRALWDWLIARDAAVRTARGLQKTGVHKQLTNRPLEPFAYIHTLITATEWDNHDNLRTNPAAQPEYQELARLMVRARKESIPVMRDLHLPFVSLEERETYTEQDLLKFSVARCARTSYARFDGTLDREHDKTRHDELRTEGHMSPFEHQAWQSADPVQMYGNFRGWQQYRKQIPGEAVFVRQSTP